jgi:hypothetical protein
MKNKYIFRGAPEQRLTPELTPEEWAAVEEAELQEAMGGPNSGPLTDILPLRGEAMGGPNSGPLTPSKAAFDCWLSFFPELKDSSYASRGLLGRIYMDAWKSGASEMLEWLQAEASTGTDPLKNGSYEAITSLD